MEIKLRLEVSETRKSITLSTLDMGYTDQEWEDLSEAEKSDEIRNYVDGYPDQPYWDIDHVEIS